jgi:hypothetical protein
MGFHRIEIGLIMRQFHKRAGTVAPFHDWSVRIEREKGSGRVERLITREVVRRTRELSKLPPRTRPKDFVVTGARSLSIIRRIQRSIAAPIRNRGLIVYLDAPARVLRRRYAAREKCFVTRGEFQKLLHDDLRLGLLSIRRNADVVLVNGGAKAALKANLDTIVRAHLNRHGE